ncbi:MAG TPA: xylulokinase [Rhodobacteraceae bacterium]|nr:xylulokinase [Paracoccaceae bacterium]
MYLGLDLGTSGLRAVLMAENGAVKAVAEQSYGVAHPHAGWSEQAPADWLSACAAAVADLRKQAPDSWGQLRGIGLSGQMHGAVLLDAEGAVLRPCILWNDTRSATEAAALDSDPDFRAISGNIVFPGFTAPKLMWVAKHEPDIFTSVAKVLLPKDYLRYWLTSTLAMDMSDAAGTSWLDVGARAWSPTLLAKSGMRPDQMPELIEGSEKSGNLSAIRLLDWGLTGPVVVAGGGGDNAAAACGTGCVSEGQGFVSLGTSGVLLAARDSYAATPETAVHTFCHALPNRWYQMGVILSATDALNWLSRTCGQSPEALSNLTGEALTAPSNTLFLPYLSGERTPHNDATIRGAFIGLDVSTDQAELTRALMQGVAFALRDSLEALRATGAKLERLLAIGGGAQSDYWLKVLATVLNLPLDLPKAGELGAALGAARLGLLADTGADPESIITPPEIARTIMPDNAQTAAYEVAYQRYRALYPALKPFSGASS